MIEQVPAKRQNCCLGVMQDMQTAAFVGLELHFGEAAELLVSMLKKPDLESESSDFFRVTSIGTVSCRGAIAKSLRENKEFRNDDFWHLGELLGVIGVPARHETIYGRALRTGQVILVLQGDGKPLRQGCRILETASLKKPILYLT